MKTIQLDAVFASLADATRRDILQRVLERPRSVGELAEAHRGMSFAAVSKHIGVLEKAKLVKKARAGRQQLVSAEPKTISVAANVLQEYQAMWDSRLNALEALLEADK